MSFVIFAGAGCSMAPPASLPNWFGLNDAILNALWEKLVPYNLPLRLRDTVFERIRERRKVNAFPPDYQAQIMVERTGLKYFELLTAVDSDAYNRFHHFAVEAAKCDLVSAVVTTNFDRNFERAFTHAGIPFRAFFNTEQFNEFERRNPGEIPVIKIHGCCSSPISLVDTRKQRLQGRAQSLESALASLLREHPFLFAGFSGADLDENENYLGLRAAAGCARGFTFLYQPGSTIRGSVEKLIQAYGSDKARSLEADATEFLEQRLKAASASCSPFPQEHRAHMPIPERLRARIAELKPMDAANMMFALVEANGDEPAARYLYDRVWKNREQLDYEDEAFERFLLNHGRSYLFNFQNKYERAREVDVAVFAVGSQPPAELKAYIEEPSRKNLYHARNTSPETVGLIALLETYQGDPILFRDFPEGLMARFRRKANTTEVADIIYYYSFYALAYGDEKVIPFLDWAIAEMEKDCDEPRLSQLLSRRAVIKFRSFQDAEAQSSARDDAARARSLAAKYHEPHLLALSALVLAIEARTRGDFPAALQLIQEAEEKYAALKRIPQYLEAAIEFLKILLIGLQDPATDKSELLRLRGRIEKAVETYMVERIALYEPEYCYLMAMILRFYTDAPDETVLGWFADAINLSKVCGLAAQHAYFRETCAQLGILEELERRVAQHTTDSGSAAGE